MPPELTGDVEITPDVRQHFVEEMSARNVDICGISGSWDEQFSNIVMPCEEGQRRETVSILILASETIYSPSSIRSFTRVLMKLLKNSSDVDRTGMALVAAKRIYFGVGGGIDEFLRVVESMGGLGSVVWETKDLGVGRVIMKILLANN